MRKTLRMLSALAAAVVVVVSFAGVAGAKSVSDTKYAERYCTIFEDAAESLNEVEGLAQSLGDARMFHGVAIAAADAAIKQVRRAGNGLAGDTPRTGGKKAAKLFDENVAAFATNLRAQRDALAAVDPGSAELSQAVGTFFVESVRAVDAFDAPLAQLTGQRKLQRAVEKACDLVRATRS